MGIGDKRRIKQAAEKPAKRFSLSELMGDKPNIELIDNTQVNIEGSRGVLEYSDTVIRINFSGYSVSFCGRGLNLKCISPTSLVIAGFILSVEFNV